LRKVQPPRASGGRHAGSPERADHFQRSPALFFIGIDSSGPRGLSPAMRRTPVPVRLLPSPVGSHGNGHRVPFPVFRPHARFESPCKAFAPVSDPRTAPTQRSSSRAYPVIRPEQLQLASRTARDADTGIRTRQLRGVRFPLADRWDTTRTGLTVVVAVGNARGGLWSQRAFDNRLRTVCGSRKEGTYMNPKSRHPLPGSRKQSADAAGMHGHQDGTATVTAEHPGIQRRSA